MARASLVRFLVLAWLHVLLVRSLYSSRSWSCRPQPLGSGGDATPCEDTRQDQGRSFLT